MPSPPLAESRRGGCAFVVGGDDAPASLDDADGLGAPCTLRDSAWLVLRACEELLGCLATPGVACDALSLSADEANGRKSQVRPSRDDLREFAEAALGEPDDKSPVGSKRKSQRCLKRLLSDRVHAVHVN